MLNNFILFIEIKILLNEETIKFNAYDQTNILDILPEKPIYFPKKDFKYTLSIKFYHTDLAIQMQYHNYENWNQLLQKSSYFFISQIHVVT